MDTLPNEIILLIFDNIKLITDRRQFLKTCKLYNITTKQLMQKFEINYRIPSFTKINKYCVEKFTLELCHDKYLHIIPKTYICSTNIILNKALRINCIKLFNTTNYDLYDVKYYSALTFYLDVMLWANENEYTQILNDYFNHYVKSSMHMKNEIYFCDLYFHLNPIINGHLELLKWARINNCVNNAYAFSMFALNSLDPLKWTTQMDYKLSAYAQTYIAHNCQNDILKWSRNNKNKYDSFTLIINLIKTITQQIYL